MYAEKVLFFMVFENISLEHLTGLPVQLGHRKLHRKSLSFPRALSTK